MPRKQSSAGAVKRPPTKTTKVTPPVENRDEEPLDRLALVRQVIRDYSKKIKEDPSKSGVAELIRLLTLERELAEEDEIREIRVSWVSSLETEPSTTA